MPKKQGCLSLEMTAIRSTFPHQNFLYFFTHAKVYSSKSFKNQINRTFCIFFWYSTSKCMKKTSYKKVLCITFSCQMTILRRNYKYYNELKIYNVFFSIISFRCFIFFIDIINIYFSNVLKNVVQRKCGICYFHSSFEPIFRTCTKIFIV